MFDDDFMTRYTEAREDLHLAMINAGECGYDRDCEIDNSENVCVYCGVDMDPDTL